MTNENKLSVCTPFEGFYESSHDAAFDSWLEYEIEVLTQDYKAKPEQIESVQDMFFNKINWKKAHEDYSKLYVKELENYIESETKYNEKPYKISLEFEALESPKYYNFSTDKIYAKIDKKDIRKMLAVAYDNLEKWREYVKENFTSYDGFNSFYSPDFEEWEKDFSVWGEARLGVLFEFFLMQILELKDKIELSEKLNGFSDMMENARCNGKIDDILFENSQPHFIEYLNLLRENKD